MALAFDDGNASDIEQALPALAERAMTARFFPLVGRIRAPGYLSGEDISKLSAARMGLQATGCTTCSRPDNRS